MSTTFFKHEGVTWSIPLLFQYEAVYGAIYSTCDEYGIRLPQAYLFGSPSVLWSGGRPPVVYHKFDRVTLLKNFNYVYRHNAVPTLTFTNSNITKEDLKDSYSNMFLDAALEVKSRFIVYSDLLRDYIKSKDPNATVIASVNRANVHFCPSNEQVEEPTVENETAYYNKMLKEYDIVVVRPEYSKGPLLKDPSLIDDLSRIEVLINQYCCKDCPRVAAHVKYNNGKNWLKAPDNTSPPFKCIRIEHPKILAMQDYLGHSFEEVEILRKAGVKHLKLQGRSNPVSMYAMILLMATQMFNFDGKYHHILYDLALNFNLDIELGKYNEGVFGITPEIMQRQQLEQMQARMRDLEAQIARTQQNRQCPNQMQPQMV